MSNPDVPRLEACKRLAKAWRASARVRCLCIIDDEAGGELDEGLPGPANEDEYAAYPARTIGEMLEEIRRRGWWGRVDTDSDAYIQSANHVHMLAEATAKDAPADALALALSKAIEKEQI